MAGKVSLLFFTIAIAAGAAAQTPDADWRTVETAHFRVHYPAEYEAWANRAATRLESIRAEVAKEIGFAPPQKIDVLVGNPIAQPNGAAFPLLDTPRIVFFAEPPGPDEQVGAYGHWIDLLAVHEVAHVVHMLRPSRNPLERLAERTILALNPITLRAPRWVLEGYATVIEGRLTGAGRPSSTIRALILRRWAESGRLPTYGQLNSDQRFLGMSMAYLMGSAFLEWLEQRGGPGSLRSLWSRLTARERRSFDTAFAGVFGDSPSRLYGRFLAEVTASAIAIDRASQLREGELFQETTRATGDPAVSPDGTQLAIAIRERDEPQKLVIWSTAPPDEEEKRFQERLGRILARDPEDVAPVRAKPLPRKAVHSLVMPDGGDIDTPRWTRDGKAILFAHRAPDAGGVLHFDLYRWDFRKVERITRLADVRDADPLTETTAVAVRSRFGASQLVTVDLLTGSVAPRTEASIDEVYSHPRVSADGRVAYVAHRGGTWSLYVDGTRVETPGDVSSPEWMGSELVYTVARGGFAELYRGATPITRARGGAFAPAPSPDGRLFFMSLEPDGFVVRVLPEIAEAAAPPAFDELLVPALPPVAPGGTQFEAATLAPSRPYGIGRQEFDWLTATTWGPDQRAFEVGVRLGDVVGRLDTLLLGSIASDDSPEGIALASAWRGWPVEILAHAYRTGRSACPDRQECLSYTGLEVRALWARRFPVSNLAIEAGALSDDLLFASARFDTRQVRGTWRFEEALRVEVDDRHYRAAVAGAVRAGDLRVGARYQLDRGDAVTVGGLPSSILPRSAYALRVLDPALPVASLAGDDYDGWRIESSVPSMPFTAFYQRHELGGASLSVAGLELDVGLDPFPILKLPGLDATAGVARIVGGDTRGGTNWWLGMRWRP